MKCCTKYIFISLFAVYAGFAQQKTRSSQLSSPEKRWAFFHPFAALKVKKLSGKAFAIVEDVKNKRLLDNYESGGQLDAFRHAFTMALLAQKIPVRKLRKLGEAHEKGNYLSFKKGKLEDSERSDSLACVMDLQNNELGFETGLSAKEISSDSLKNLVILKIKSGKASYIKRNEAGNYTDCSGKEIVLAEWRNRWFVPKCLIH